MTPLKKSLLLSLSIFLFATGYAQNSIVKIDFQNHSIDKLGKLPYNEPFILEGNLEEDIDLVEVSIRYENSKKNLNTYVWDRVEYNRAQNFEMVISNPLNPNSEYDIEVKSFKKMTADEKENLEIDLSKRVVYYLKNQIVVDGNKLSIENPKKVQKGLNTLLNEATYYQRSRNGIAFDRLSSLVENEIEKLGDVKLKIFYKKKSAVEKNQISNQILNEKLKYLAEIVISEIKPFLNSDLVRQKKSFVIKSVQTGKEQFTLPINIGMSMWNIKTSSGTSTLKTTSITPSLGITLPFSRGLNLKQHTISSFGLSIGVLTKPLVNANDVELATPSVKLPMYAALGFKMFNFLRISGGTLIVSEVGTQSKQLKLYPTFSASLELNLWLGIKK